MKKRMYSDERMEVLRREHGFDCYLDEAFTAPDPIMAALVVSHSVTINRVKFICSNLSIHNLSIFFQTRHNVDKVLVGGEGVQNRLER